MTKENNMKIIKGYVQGDYLLRKYIEGGEDYLRKNMLSDFCYYPMNQETFDYAVKNGILTDEKYRLSCFIYLSPDNPEPIEKVLYINCQFAFEIEKED